MIFSYKKMYCNDYFIKQYGNFIAAMQLKMNLVDKAPYCEIGPSLFVSSRLHFSENVSIVCT